MADVPSGCGLKNNTKKDKNVKKKTRNPEEWHKQRQKRLRIAGKEHTSTSGKTIPAKQMGADCNCKRSCYQRVPQEIRLKTFQGYYSMKTHDEQNAYLFGLMRQIDIKRKRVKNSTRRTCTFEYYIRVRGRETQVCQTAFKNIHAITERKVRVLCKKMDDGVMFPSDNRGKSSTRRAGQIRLASEIIDQVKLHIFNIVHTHRLKDFIRLDKVSGLEINIAKMWKDYVKTYDPDNFIYLSKNGISSKNQQNMPPQSTQPLQNFQIQTTEAYAPIYPGSGHLFNIAENYFQSQYYNQICNQNNVNTVNYYPVTVASNGPNVNTGNEEENTQSCSVGTTPTILMYTSTAVIPEVPVRLEDSVEKQKPSKVSKKQGPLVKQWRYTNIFHEEINGVALAAIKTRLGMYYSESEVAKKKSNMSKTQTEPVSQQLLPPDNVSAPAHSNQTEPVSQQLLPPNNVSAPAHSSTSTIAIINLHRGNAVIQPTSMLPPPPPLQVRPQQHPTTLHHL